MKNRFIDIDLNFGAHPITGDIVKKTDVQAIVASMKNLILTEFYERPFHPEIGSQVNGLLFENVSSITASLISEALINVIENYEPRVRILNITATPDSTGHGYDTSIHFKIIDVSDPIRIEFYLTRTR